MFLDKLKNWKPIHLCWWFEKHGWPIPKYFIGGGGDSPNLDQVGFIFGDPVDNADGDPDTHPDWDARNAARTGQAKSAPFFVRICVENNGAVDSSNSNFELHYNLTGVYGDGVTQITTTPGVLTIVNDTYDEVADQGATDTDLTSTGAGDWQNGEYIDASNNTGKISLVAAYFTEIMFCVQFEAGAGDETDYYFFLNSDPATPLDAYTESGVKVTTAVAAAGGPRGPLGHPFNGPFGGPT